MKTFQDFSPYNGLHWEPKQSYYHVSPSNFLTTMPENFREDLQLYSNTKKNSKQFSLHLLASKFFCLPHRALCACLWWFVTWFKHIKATLIWTASRRQLFHLQWIASHFLQDRFNELHGWHQMVYLRDGYSRLEKAPKASKYYNFWGSQQAKREMNIREVLDLGPVLQKKSVNRGH